MRCTRPKKRAATEFRSRRLTHSLGNCAGAVVLHAGCAYSAPVYVFCLRWRAGAPPAEGGFHRVVADAIDGARLSDDARARALIEEFLGSSAAPIPCRYSAEAQTMYVGGRPVVRGVPAIILRNCLQMYLASGRREFAFREFKTDAEVISRPKNTGFEVRLRRLRESLEAAACGIWIEPTRRGHFALKAYGEVSLEGEGCAR